MSKFLSNCPKCGGYLDVIDTEQINKYYKRIYYYCFECDKTFIRNILSRDD